MKKQFFALGTAALMTAALPSIAADAEVEVKTDVDKPKTEARTEIKRKGDVDTDVRVDRQSVKRTDKASGLIGMEVRNRQNEKLGEIKDLVMDMNSGKVSYVVLSVGGFLGIGEKLIALPPNVAKVGDNPEYIVLDADKAKIQAAPGFAATAWPAPNDPEVNRYWTDLKATGSAASSEKGRDIDVDADVDVDTKKTSRKVDVDTDKKKIYTDADKDRKVKVEVEKD